MKMTVNSTKDTPFLFTFRFVWIRAIKSIMDIMKPAQLGGKAPNLELVDLEKKSSVFLLDMAKAGRPLVLNFGSCT